VKNIVLPGIRYPSHLFKGAIEPEAKRRGLRQFNKKVDDAADCGFW
jgi:hypothetical protein